MVYLLRINIWYLLRIMVLDVNTLTPAEIKAGKRTAAKNERMLQMRPTLSVRTLLWTLSILFHHHSATLLKSAISGFKRTGIYPLNREIMINGFKAEAMIVKAAEDTISAR